MNCEQIHFVTGRLAEPALRVELEKLARRFKFGYSVQVMPISVAALMTGTWIAKRIRVPANATAVLLPGYTGAGLEAVQEVCTVPVRLGPKDLRDLSEVFGESPEKTELGLFDIEIIAEINHAPQLPITEILRLAESMVRDGADVIDIGCDPAGGWASVGDCVSMLRDQGIRVSVDSFDPEEIAGAARAGAELVLSVNSSNVDAASDWGIEVVVVPDSLTEWTRMESVMESLERRGVKFRIDPILEPLGIGLAASLHRYAEARSRWPIVSMMMGIGNATELTDADSAAINLLLIGICQEQAIHSVLTTQVINWARTSVRECDIARRIAWYAVNHRIPAKRLSDELVIVRDARPDGLGQEFLEELAKKVQDRNFRLFADANNLSVIGDRSLWQGSDPFEVFDAMMKSQSETIDTSHAFYLGYELCKAEIAANLGKRYIQDEALDWGYLTKNETNRHRLKKVSRKSQKNDGHSDASESENPD